MLVDAATGELDPVADSRARELGRGRLPFPEPDPAERLCGSERRFGALFAPDLSDVANGSSGAAGAGEQLR
jgi:hypothetical protein